MVLIREARISDAGGIGKVNVESWQTTYRGIMSNSILQQLSMEVKKEKWRNIIQAGGSTTLVAVDAGEEVVGYLNMSIKKESAGSARVGEVTSAYLLEGWQRKGIGKALLLESFKRFIEQSIQTVQVEVLAANDSRLFYEHFGAELVEKRDIQIAGDILELFVYEWRNILKQK
ncbi:GNAT family N-acetyltransferase [Oceanobacillus sp. J11TS1]|uniref:GNAT family N-acetyltransferase n=1 Tax=Oceanobacillus sp. J11TS1 TaxID=2807191 RepID=UPI001B0141E8|nr:GNAT family N-acetyltransferase [Oceanobacillus sp. J11TS1]GIO23537.1 N-acetyltransferase [Oceanobacillus sp. J11TS1]